MTEEVDSFEDQKEVLLEGRTILPGVQTLFSFLLVSVFTDSFGKLDEAHHIAHFACVFLAAFTICVLLIPVAYDQNVTPGRASKRNARLGTTCVRMALGSFSASLALAMFLIADASFRSVPLSVLLASVTFGGLIFAWFILPLLFRR